MSTELTLLKKHKCFDGYVCYYGHKSQLTGTKMRFAAYLPAAAEQQKLPVLYWLSGLTCNEQNFMVKAGAAYYAAKHELIIIAPDTSPRGDEVADEKQRWDLGQGAGFYVDALQQPWAKHYQMLSYIVDELPALVKERLPATQAQSISGHSMGGHGALIAALRFPERYKSVSAFSPICAPTQCQWGQDAFTTYLGDDRSLWQQYDAVELVKSSELKNRRPLLIDQGEEDEFLKEQLKTPLLIEACQYSKHDIDVRMRPGYDHSYYFISTFIGEHMAYHAQYLKGE